MLLTQATVQRQERTFEHWRCSVCIFKELPFCGNDFDSLEDVDIPCAANDFHVDKVNDRKSPEKVTDNDSNVNHKRFVNLTPQR